MNLEDVKVQAEWELSIELFEKAVEAEKEKLRHKRSFWKRVFPFTITITRDKPAANPALHIPYSQR